MSRGASATRVEVKQLTPERVDDFFQLHSIEHGCGWCFCVAWWTPTWQGWGERTAEENFEMRMALFSQGEYDGYLAYIESDPIGWCQVGRRGRLQKLVEQFNLSDTADDPEIWSITCFLVSPDWRRRKIATTMLAEVLDDLKERGVKQVEAYPKRGDDLDDLDLWNGAEAMYLEAGFEVVHEDDQRLVLCKILN
jgi:GNAT superfamily N-acetyltransferase